MGLLAATWFDVGLVAFHALVVIVIASYFLGERRHGSAAAQRPVGWVPVAFSFPAMFVPWLTLSDLAGESYDLGTRLWLMPLAVLVSVPVVVWFIVPLSQRLGGVGALDYLELRFSPGARRGAAMLYGVARIALAAAWLAWTARQLTDGAGLNIPAWIVVAAAGAIGTLCATLGERRGATWIDAWQAVLLGMGVVFLMMALMSQPGVTADSVSDAVKKLGRGPAFDPSFVAPDGWTLLTAFPGYVLLSLAFFGIDLVAQQRWSTAGKTADAQRGLLFGGIGVSFLLAVVVYAGVALLDVYQHHPSLLRGRWIANVDSVTRRSLTDPATRRKPLVDPRTGEPVRSLLDDEPSLDPTDGRPLLNWYADEVTANTIPQLIDERRLLRPNNKEPIDDVADVTDASTGKIQLERLAMRRPTEGREIILHRRANGELLTWFTARQLPWGCLAIAWCGLLASGLSGVVATALAVSRAWSGPVSRATAESLAAETTPASLPRTKTPNASFDRMTPIVGAVVVAIALALLSGDLAKELLGPLAAITLTPLAVTFMLGLALRRGTSGTALAGAATCLIVTSLAWGYASLPHERTNEPAPLHPLAAVPLGAIAGLLVGGGGAMLTRARSRSELRGLTLGCGPLGVREAHSAVGAAGDFLISVEPPPLPPNTPRWRE